jgi:hypothetical protein
MVDLGWGVLDGAQVETACLITGRICDSRILFFSPTFSPGQPETSPDWVSPSHAIIRPLSYFLKIPNCALAYDLPSDLLALFLKFGRCEPEIGDARQGLGISDSWRWYRSAAETPIDNGDMNQNYAWLTNGGGFAPFYRDSDSKIFWKDNGSSIKKTEGIIYGSWSRTVKNVSYYFRNGISFPKRTDHLNAHILPVGFIFTVEGLGFFPAHTSGSEEAVWESLCLFNSRLEAFLINRFCGQHKHVGYLKNLPAPDSRLSAEAILLCKEAVELKRRWSTLFSNTAHFTLPALLLYDPNAICCPNLTETAQAFEAARSIGVRQVCSAITDLVMRSNLYLQSLQDQIDEHVFDVFQIAPNTRSLLRLETSSRPDCTVLQGVIEANSPSSELWIYDLVDYLVGCVFGRWDIRIATGEIAVPELPDPLDRPPICPPGQLKNIHGLAASQKDLTSNYPIKSLAWHGTLVDDPGHLMDIEGRVREVLRLIWSARSLTPSIESVEQEICEILGVASLGEYIRRPSGLFTDHLKRYSKSRRQAPIYWPISTDSGNYTLWLYYHRVNDQTLYTVVNDFVEPRLKDVVERLRDLRGKSNRDRVEEDEFEQLSNSASELEDFRSELLRIGKFWKPNLNDGVQITAAPLWRFFHLKKWRDTLKKTWEELEEGQYDWAHLAFSIWPDRVVRSAHNDRSIAVAHGLEAVLWHEVEVKKSSKTGRVTVKLEWQPRELSEKQLDAIVECVKNGELIVASGEDAKS